MRPPFFRLFLSLLFGLLAPTFLRAQTDASAAGAPSTSPAYVLTNTDRVSVTIYQEDDLSRISRIDAQGRINLPLVGEVTVAGLRVAEAEEIIAKAYQEGRFLRAPRVTITVEEYASREVSIQGQVRNPGRYPLPIESNMTIVELVTRAGGFTDTAKGTAVRITRILPDGTKKNFDIDVDSLIKGRRGANVKDNALILEAGDIVFVPERLI